MASVVSKKEATYKGSILVGPTGKALLYGSTDSIWPTSQDRPAVIEFDAVCLHNSS